MASIRKDIPIDASPDAVWAAVRDFGAVDRRLAPGFVTKARLDGEARIVTFHNGTVARELLVDCDEARRRLVYAIVNDRVKHYNASVQVVGNGETSSCIVWIVDVLPSEVAPYIDGQMDLAVLAMQKALSRGTAASVAVQKSASLRLANPSCGLASRNRKMKRDTRSV
jgi:Polyketide cyclase / dehydrase and lipid transport